MLRKLDKRVKVVLASQVIYAFSMQFLAQYNTLFAQALGASGADIGLMNSISALAIVAASAYIGLAIERYSVKTVMILGLTFDALAMAFFIFASDWRFLIPAFILYGQLVRQMALADIVFITFTAPHERATVMSFARLLWGGAAISAPLAAAATVTYYGGINAQGIRPLYYVALAIIMALLIVLYRCLDELGFRTATRGKPV